jgi:hypothetical protein
MRGELLGSLNVGRPSSIVIKLGQNACLSNCSDELDGSGERSRAILTLLFFLLLPYPLFVCIGQESYTLNYGQWLIYASVERSDHVTKVSVFFN